MSKKLLVVFVVLAMVVALVGCGKTPAADEPAETGGAPVDETGDPVAEAVPVTLEIVASQPEYQTQEEEIWSVYTAENPHVTIEMTAINEDTAAAYEARVASGDAPDLILNAGADKANYKTYQNLAEIDYPYWDLLQYDAVDIFSQQNGTDEGYCPVLNPFAGLTFSFIYYADEMEKTGLTPRESIRSMADLDQFLADLKVYTDANGIDYPLDAGWHSWCVFNQEIDMLAVALGASETGDLYDLWYNHSIAWTDIENNPYVPAFEKLKEWYDNGYMPEKWWTRNWETDYEAGFTAKNSILCYHGPWLWTKVLTADPSAQLSGFPLPPNADGVIQNNPVDPGRGTALYTCNKDGENQAEAVKAFSWWCGPEALKMRAEAFGTIPLMDMSSVGSPEIDSPQYNEIVKPIQEGFFGDVTFDSSLWGIGQSYKFMVKDAPQILAADEMATNYGDYFEGKITIEDLMAICQQRFDTGMDFDQ